jgi:glycosyltransferase involved in cell wall biosynthesis
MTPRLVNVTLPAHNEEAQLADNLRRLRDFVAGQTQYRWEIVVVENGSTDATFAVAQREAKSARGSSVQIQALHVEMAGRGGALREAWLNSKAEILSYMDVDLSTDLACLPALIEAVASRSADVSVGSRLLPGSDTTRCWKREILSRVYNRLLRWQLHLQVHDAQCGFKAISREAARSLLPQVRDRGWFFDTELLWLAERGTWRVKEIPVRWVDDPGTTVKLWSTIWHDLAGVRRLKRAARSSGPQARQRNATPLHAPMNKQPVSKAEM